MILTICSLLVMVLERHTVVDVSSAQVPKHTRAGERCSEATSVTVRGEIIKER